MAFRQSLSELVIHAHKSEGKKPILFVLIDELDRCRPTYAIALLERVKHLFSANNVVFVIATDSSQLSHTIRGAYGDEFDGQTYLRKFFDRTYRFKSPNLEQFARQISAALPEGKIRFPTADAHNYILATIDHFGLALRDAEQVFEVVKDAITIWRHKLPIEGVTLFATAATYHLTGDASFGDVRRYAKELANEPRNSDKGKWQADVLIHSQQSYDRATERRKPNLIEILNSMNMWIEDIASTDARRNQTSTFEYEYIRDIILPEWNGLPIKPRSPSIHKDIEPLVQNAGLLN